MSCDFKVGDEVVCVDDGNQRPDRPKVQLHQVYVIHAIFPAWNSHPPHYRAGDPIVALEGLRHAVDGQECGFRASRFRKVQRRDLQAWLATENTIEGPLRTKEHAK